MDTQSSLPADGQADLDQQADKLIAKIQAANDEFAKQAGALAKKVKNDVHALAAEVDVMDKDLAADAQRANNQLDQVIDRFITEDGEPSGK